MKIKANVIVNMGTYEHVETEIEIDVPDDLKNQDLVRWLYKEYHGLLVKPEVCESCGGGVGIDEKGVKTPIKNGLHEACRTQEFVYKKQNL